MTVDLLQFSLSGPVKSAARLLAGALGFRVHPAYSATRYWLDTYDWRLLRRGEALESEPDGGDCRLLWYRPAEGRILRRLTLPESPRFARDMPPGPVREALEPVTGERALLPRAGCRCRVVPYERTDADGKVVLRAALETWRLLDDHGRPRGRPWCWLRLYPVKGYRRVLDHIRTAIEASNLFEWHTDHPLERLLARLGRTPCDYSPGLRVTFEPGQQAGAAVRRLLLHLLEMLERNVEGTCADTDPEFLHDLRVSVRRTRTALGQFGGVLPRRGFARFRNGFAWLGQVTSPTRDLDVYLLKFERYRDSLPPEQRPHLAPLRDFLEAHQRIEQQRLARVLRSQRFRHLIAGWRAWLETEPVRPPAEARQPVETLAAARIWHMYKRVRREGRAIGGDSPAEALHELRKSCKKLRYLLEFFQCLYPAKRHRRLVKALKGLQDNLGDFQDLEVQGHTLERFAGEMQVEGEVPAATLEAIAHLVENLHHRQAQARREFHERFSGFDSESNRRLFRSLFREEAHSRS